MSNKIDIKELSNTITKYLSEYKDDISEEVKECADKVTKEAVKELKETSPRGKGTRTNPYYNGWTTKISKNQKNKYYKVIWNRTNYQLTHLLEFGHATRSGERAKAIPHIRPVEEKYNKEFTDLVEKKIKEVK